jgi:hypothetical protein
LPSDDRSPTNGANPCGAIGLAAKLRRITFIFINIDEPPENAEMPRISSTSAARAPGSPEELEFPQLLEPPKNANIQTIRELVKSENEMLKTKNLPEIAQRDQVTSGEDGLSLGMKFDEHGRIIWPPLPELDSLLPTATKPSA